MNSNKIYDIPTLLFEFECTSGSEEQEEIIDLIRSCIGSLITEVEELSEYICYLESILELHEIEYHKS